MITFHPGRLPNDPSKPRLKLGKYLTVDHKPSVDWLSGIDYPMYLNDSLGDCTCAAVGHIIETNSKFGTGALVEITDNDVLTAYEVLSGYNPSTGANDNGAVVQDVLNYWRKTGFAGHKIIAFAELDHNNIDECKAACEIFGSVYLGINFPNTAMDQFNAGQPWDVVSAYKIEGGHAINAGKYDDNWYVVTWGQIQEMTQPFWDKFVEEAWVVITPEWVSGNDTPEGIDIHALGDDFAQLTGEGNPFPPNPKPTPAPPRPVDKGFWSRVWQWIEHNIFGIR